MSESVFHQLYDDPDKATNYATKAELMIVIEHLIKRSGLNNSQVATLVGTQRSRISELMNGKIEKISLDSLNTWLAILSGGTLKMAVVPSDASVSAADTIASLS
jgi:predicted XRE-type DNA-binding protein